MNQTLDEPYREELEQLVNRLERLSADSTYAHQASGLRGTLLRHIERIENGEQVNYSELSQLVESGFEILRLAAKEIGAYHE
jgi:hypothetical protein